MHLNILYSWFKRASNVEARYFKRVVEQKMMLCTKTDMDCASTHETFHSGHVKTHLLRHPPVDTWDKDVVFVSYIRVPLLLLSAQFRVDAKSTAISWFHDFFTGLCLSAVFFWYPNFLFACSWLFYWKKNITIFNLIYSEDLMVIIINSNSSRKEVQIKGLFEITLIRMAY